MTKKELLSNACYPLVALAAWIVRLLPPKAEVLFLNAIRILFNPNTSDILFEGALCRFLKPRGAWVSVQSLLMHQWVDAKVELDLGDYIQRAYYLHGYPDFMPDLLRFCDADTHFFDIGANVGLISLGIATVTPQENIHAFEPVPATFERLRHNLAASFPRIECHRAAVSDANGEINLAIIDIDSGSSTVQGDYLVDRLKANRTEAKMRHESCPTVTFDSVWSRVASGKSGGKVAIKIDVEGHELSVLRGMGEFLGSSRMPVLIVCETHLANLPELRGMLESHGFQLRSPPAEILADPGLFGSAKDLIFHRDPLPRLPNLKPV